MKDDPRDSSYAGRWVARVRGDIVAQAGTPRDARRAAQGSRRKERPEINYMPVEVKMHPLIDRIKALIPPSQEIYLVGGAVRDMLLQRQSPDLDFALPADSLPIARRVANSLKADYVTLDEKREVGRVIVVDEKSRRTFLDFIKFQGGADIESDLRARDFTINSLAYDLQTGSILDPLDGARDLRARIIRACSATSFDDDPVRILRAVRMAAALNFHIDPQTRKWMKAAAASLDRTSPERLRDELFKMLEGPQPDACLRALDILGVLPHLLPELIELKNVAQPPPHVQDVWLHTLAVLRWLEQILSALRVGYDPGLTNDLLTGLLSLQLGRFREHLAAHFSEALNPDRSLRGLLFFTALYHDVAKPQTSSLDETGRLRFLGHDEQGARIAAERAGAFHLSNDEIERVQVIIRNHMRFHNHVSRLQGEGRPPSRRAIYRFFRDTGKAGVELVLLGLADTRGTHSHTLTQETWSAALSVARIFLENYWEKPEETVSPPKLLDGHELMAELHLEPGVLIGELLEAVREAQATGKIESREQALDFAGAWLRDKS